jgi:hypothetical protein
MWSFQYEFLSKRLFVPTLHTNGINNNDTLQLETSTLVTLNYIIRFVSSE